VVFLVLTAGGIVWAQWFWDVHQQDKNVLTYVLCGVGFLCLMLWLLVLSQLPWRTRWIAVGVIALLHVVVLGSMRIEGVDGNLVPIVEWRWESGSAMAGRLAGTDADAESGVGGLPDGWPQFLGPNRNGEVDGMVLATNWVDRPPKERWRMPMGAGWSGFAVARGLAVTQEQDGTRERVSCFEARTGRRIWTHAYQARYATTIAGEGPRATPSIDGDRVYAVGATGWLTCLDLTTGRVLWARNVLDEHDGRVPEWGYSVSPLVVGGRVILSVGGSEARSLVALDVHTGKTLWAGGEDGCSYSSPILHTWAGVPQVVVFNAGSVAGHNLDSGALLWQQPYARSHVHVAAPLPFGTDRVLFSSGYGHGSELYHVRRDADGRWAAELVWKTRRLKAKFVNPIEHDGFLYSLDDGVLTCLSVETGEPRWRDGRYGHGQVLRVGDHLLVMSESGQLVLIEPSPDGLRELGRHGVFTGKTWNPPALAGSSLFLRTDHEAVCLQLPLRE
jgi:outer membrane protein assembly factor BamB